MSVQWVTDRSGQWVSKTADGYYAVSHEHAGEFMAHHIEALWAKPAEIGHANTLTGAQGICDAHRARLSTVPRETNIREVSP